MSNDNAKPFDSLGRRKRSADGTVQHGQTYWCVVEDSSSARAHRAVSRHRVPGTSRQVPLCQAHSQEWKDAGLVARRSGPGGGRA